MQTEAAVHLYLARRATAPVGLELALSTLKSSKAVNSGSAFLVLLDLRGPKAGSPQVLGSCSPASAQMQACPAWQGMKKVNAKAARHKSCLCNTNIDIVLFQGISALTL